MSERRQVHLGAGALPAAKRIGGPRPIHSDGVRKSALRRELVVETGPQSSPGSRLDYGLEGRNSRSRHRQGSLAGVEPWSSSASSNFIRKRTDHVTGSYRIQRPITNVGQS